MGTIRIGTCDGCRQSGHELGSDNYCAACVARGRSNPMTEERKNPYPILCGIDYENRKVQLEGMQECVRQLEALGQAIHPAVLQVNKDIVADLEQAISLWEETSTLWKKLSAFFARIFGWS